MADKEQVTLSKIAKLVAAQNELLDKFAAISDELDALLTGKAGIGATLTQLESYYSTVWESRYTGDYVWNFAKDRAHLKRLLRTLSVEQIQVRMLNYMKNDDPFYVNKRHPFGVFVAAVNSFAALGKPIDGFDLGDAVGDCRHKPRCGNDAQHTRRKREELAAFR